MVTQKNYKLSSMITLANVARLFYYFRLQKRLPLQQLYFFHTSTSLKEAMTGADA